MADNTQSENFSFFQKMFHRIAVLISFTAISRVLGLFRDMVMAWSLGSTIFADALVVAIRFPNVIRRLLADGTLSMTFTANLCNNFIPWYDLKKIIFSLFIYLILFSLCILFLVPYLGKLLAPGFSENSLAYVNDLLYISLPYISFACICALCMGILHSIKIFWVSALSPIILNIVILVFSVYAVFLGKNVAFYIAFGFLFGGICQCLLHILGLWHNRFKIDQFCSISNKKKERIFTKIPIGLISLSTPQISFFIAMILASFWSQGSISSLYYAERLLELPLGLVGISIGMATLPELGEVVANKDYDSFLKRLSLSIFWTLLFSIPAMVGLLIISYDLILFIFGHGIFSLNSVQETYLSLCFYIPSLPVFALTRILLVGYNSLGKVSETKMSTVYCILVVLALGLILGHILPANIVGVSPALAVSIGLLLQSILLWKGLQSILRNFLNNAILCSKLMLIKVFFVTIVTGILAAMGLIVGKYLGFISVAFMIACISGFLGWIYSLRIWKCKSE